MQEVYPFSLLYVVEFLIFHYFVERLMVLRISTFQIIFILTIFLKLELVKKHRTKMVKNKKRITLI